ncbi:MAG: twin-arginine translocase TatA/TatE family subunit [Nitrospinales bacterium]
MMAHPGDIVSQGAAMFDIGFFELMIIMTIAVLVVGPKNLPRLAKAVGKGWKEFQSTFEGLKDEVMEEADNLKNSVNIDQLEQDVSSATKIDVDVDLNLDDKPTKS